jgi:hypothetical protein
MARGVPPVRSTLSPDAITDIQIARSPRVARLFDEWKLT